MLRVRAGAMAGWGKCWWGCGREGKMAVIRRCCVLLNGRVGIEEAAGVSVSKRDDGGEVQRWETDDQSGRQEDNEMAADDGTPADARSVRGSERRTAGQTYASLPVMVHLLRKPP